MNLFGICLIKNEADIIEYSLTKASTWANQIFVYDNGSTDDTWGIVQEMAKSNSTIIPWKSEAKPFRDGLRAEVFNEFKHLARKGDWWCCRLDSDEFYIDPPRKFLKNISPHYHVVTSKSYQYRLAVEDVNEYEFLDDFQKDREYIRYYSPIVHSETRFFRHRDRLHWPTNRGYPLHVGMIAPQKIKLQHFQYRSPQQIERRIITRIEATKGGYRHFGRDNVSHWREKLIPRNQLIKQDPLMSYDSIKDNNKIPWYWWGFRMFMHFFKIYP